jgi:hypothetical protein
MTKEKMYYINSREECGDALIPKNVMLNYLPKIDEEDIDCYESIILSQDRNTIIVENQDGDEKSFPSGNVEVFVKNNDGSDRGFEMYNFEIVKETVKKIKEFLGR